jgi:hypothetical protein
MRSRNGTLPRPPQQQGVQTKRPFGDVPRPVEKQREYESSPSTAQPFKQAFKEQQQQSNPSPVVPEPAPKASLTQLNPGSNNKKAPSLQNIQSLKDVLAEVMAKKADPTPPKESFPRAETIAQVSRIVEQAKSDMNKPVVNQDVAVQDKGVLPNEIPESVLRKVLE